MNSITMNDLHILLGIARNFFGETAIIAGGAPRDILSGVRVKDIDVFVHEPEFEESAESESFKTNCANFLSFIAMMHGGGVGVFREHSGDYGQVNDLYGITGIPSLPDIEIIALSCMPIDDICCYDFTISRVFVDRHSVFQTLEASSDRANKIVRYVYHSSHDLLSIARSRRRLERLRQKYLAGDGWTFVNCEQIEAILKPY